MSCYPLRCNSLTLIVVPSTLDSNRCRLSHVFRSKMAAQHGFSDTHSDRSIRCHSDDDFAAAARFPIVSACRTLLALWSGEGLSGPLQLECGAVLALSTAKFVCWFTKLKTLSVRTLSPQRLRHCTSWNRSTKIILRIVGLWKEW